MLLQAFYSIRSERQLMERLEFDLLFRWFVGLGVDDAVWDERPFQKTATGCWRATSRKFLGAVPSIPRVKRLLPSDHFSVDGTLIEAWASMKSFKPKEDGERTAAQDPPAGRNGEMDFHGELRTNATHVSTTDPDARLYRKGRGRRQQLCFLAMR